MARTTKKSTKQKVKQPTRFHVVYNNQESPYLSVRQIFDSRKYNQLIGVTGKLSPDFVNDNLANFVKTEIVVGSPEEREDHTAAEMVTKVALADALQSAANREPAKLFQALTSQLQLAVLGGVFKVESAPTQAIHSRFYLMANPDTHDTRLVLTTADLTPEAFDPHHNQFEEILIFDNQPLYDNMLVHFKTDIAPVVRPFFSSTLLKAAQKQIDSANHDDDQKAGAVVALPNDVTDEIAITDMTNILSKDVDKHIKDKLISDLTPRDMRDVTADRSQVVASEQRRIRQRDIIYNLQKESVSPRAAHPKLKDRSTIRKRVGEAMQSSVDPEEEAAEKKYKTFLLDRPMERNVAKDETGLFVPNETGTRPLPFGKQATITQIRDGLRSIDDVMKGYQQFVIDYTPEYGKRFFEAILYAFTAPFLWEIRDRASLNPEDGNDIPNFLFLGATAGSGKSTLLRIINQLTWNTDRSLIDFGTIYPANVAQRKAKTTQALDHYMNLGSTYPVLVDEIEPYFFQQNQYNRHLVVDTMNKLVNHPHAIAPLIGTTNYNSGFTMVRETARRSYYLQIDKVIDESRKGEANKYIYNVRQTLNNDLFKDFVIRMANLLEDDNTPWRKFDKETGRLDFLSNTRTIFKRYYELAGQKLPDYFSETICDDFKESARNRWAKLFLTQQSDFIYREKDASLLFDISKLNTFNGFSADSVEEYRNALPVELCVNGINGKAGKFMEIKAQPFFDWIGEDNPYDRHAKHKQSTNNPPKKRGFFARLFG